MDLSAIDVPEMLNRLDIRNIHMASGGAEVNFSCPFPGHSHGDEKPSAYMNTSTSAWFCWGCKKRGNAITFLAELHGVSNTIAKRWLREAFGIDFLEPAGGSMVIETEMRFPHVERPEPEPPPMAPESFLSTIAIDWEDGLEPAMRYLFDRGLNVMTMREWGVGYDFLSDRPCWPIRDLDGKLVGVKGRAWRDGQEPRYYVFGDRGENMRYGFVPCDQSEYVFGLERERDHDTVVLVEGELDAMALWQAGVRRPIATGMSFFSPRHAQLITREASEVVVLYDDDAAGHVGIWGQTAADGSHLPGIVDLLESKIRVRIVGQHDHDPMELAALGRIEEALELIEGAPSTVALSLPFASV